MGVQIVTPEGFGHSEAEPCLTRDGTCAQLLGTTGQAPDHTPQTRPPQAITDTVRLPVGPPSLSETATVTSKSLSFQED